MNLQVLEFGGRTYANVPREIVEGASLNVAHRRALLEGDLRDPDQFSPTDYALALAALVGSGLLEQYRIHDAD